MSQHIFETTDANGEAVTVTMGYDRRLDYIFCTVMKADDDFIYSNLDDNGAGIDQHDVDYYRPVLERLGICVPESVFRETAADQRGRVGTRVVNHSAGS